MIRIISSDKNKTIATKNVENDESQAKKRSNYEMLCTKLFERIIANEAQGLKNFKTHAHLNVFDMMTSIINFLTITSMMNKFSDFENLLAFAWKEEWAREEDENCNFFLHDYIDSQTTLIDKVLDFNDLRAHAWALNLIVFRRHEISSKFIDQMNSLVANFMIFTILFVIQLRRIVIFVIEDVNDIDLRIVRL